MRVALFNAVWLRLGAMGLLVSCLLVPSTHASANVTPTQDRTEARKDYIAARKALAQNQLSTYRNLLPKLQDYPLLPYLEYEEIGRRLGSLPRADVANFFSSYPESFLSDRLAHRWLRTLASRKLWEDYNNFYDARLSRDPELACNALHARLKTKDLTALDEVEPLWNIDRSQSKACDPVFSQWIAAGRMTPELVWERHNKALATGNRALAGYLGRQLPTEQQPLAKLMQDVHADPRILSQKTRFSTQSSQMRDILIYGLHKLANQDARTALALWRGYDAQHFFDDNNRREIQYQLASRLMRQKHPDLAEQVLNSMPEITRTDLAEWLLRDALRKQDWEKVNEWITRLPEDAQKTERWSYWRARTMEELKIKEVNGVTPNDIYAGVATTRSFYGFLSADKLGFEYGLVDKPMVISEELYEQVEHSPGIQRARELYILGEMGAANREWYHSTRNMSNEEIVAAGRIANVWGWHRHGIQAMIDAEHWDDLQVRFPLAYQDQVANAAKTVAINPLFLYAIARQESAFMADARSPVGAMGLMQLMPATARQTAQRSGLTYTPQDLLKPEKNIALGSRYLNELLGQFDGNRILAAAAYNAGPSRVKQWLSKNDEKLPYDVWIEIIPFHETRGYVQNVLSFSVIYAYRTGAKQAFITHEEANSSL